MEQTTPAQAMELRSLSPALARLRWRTDFWGGAAMKRIAVATIACLLIGHGPGLAQSAPPDAGDAKEAVTDARAEAKKSGKYVLLNFGADWCGECRQLEKTFADPTVAKFLRANFVVVKVPVGQMVGLNYAEQNVDLVRKYGVFTTAENAGIPSIVILDSAGNVRGRTDKGEWRRGDAVLPENVIRDLRRWAPKR